MCSLTNLVELWTLILIVYIKLPLQDASYDLILIFLVHLYIPWHLIIVHPWCIGPDGWWSAHLKAWP
jgi:hypothetical protein